MPAPGSPSVSFPHQDEFARKFFAEAVRHLDDARVLHRARRYPGSITSSQKALLSPGKPDLKEFKPEVQVNTEYPFFYLLPPPNGPATSHFQGPSEYFTSTDSLGHYRTAHELLSAYQSLYPAVKRWRHRLPRAL